MKRIGNMQAAALLSGLLALILLGSSVPMTSQAGIWLPENIRVALFIDIGKFYRGTVPSVTLTPAPRTPLSTTIQTRADANAVPALTIGERAPGRITPWFTVTDSAPRRFAPDSLMVALLESESYSKAKTLADQLTGTTVDKAHMDIVYRKGKPLFRVLAGMYSDRSQAETARNRLLARAAISKLTTSAQTYLVGTKRLFVGSFTKESDARKRIDSLRVKGLHPAINIIADSKGTETFVVSLAEAVDDAQLQVARNAAVAAEPELASTIRPLEWSAISYLHVKEAVFPRNNDHLKSSFYLFNPVGQRVYVSPGTVEGIRVDERDSRIYRGTFELLRYEGKLTVINELPFETYLCSVVGAEMGSLFSPEALRAQAIIARTYAAAQSTKYKIANVSDTVFDQAYKGVGTESPKVNAAVKDTEDLFLLYRDQLVSAVYFSNAGGITAESEEVWGGDRSYYRSVSAPDEIAASGLPTWHRVALADGTIGYVHGNFVRFTGKENGLGLRELQVTGNSLQVRPMPSSSSSDNAPLATLKKDATMILIDSVTQSNSYSWIEGPYTAARMLQSINAKISKPISGSLQTLEVTKKGPSGRVMEMKANGQSLGITVPDRFRTVMGGLRSTLFDIEETGRYTVLGANGKSTEYPRATSPLAVISGKKTVSTLSDKPFIIINGDKQIRVATKDARFRFIGKGFGHGLGLSQWGAEGLARNGMKHPQILQYFYPGVTLTTD